MLGKPLIYGTIFGTTIDEPYAWNDFRLSVLGLIMQLANERGARLIGAFLFIVFTVKLNTKFINFQPSSIGG